MAEKLFPIEQILTMLAEAPQRIADATLGLSPQQLRTRPAPEEWSVNEVLAHLRACADVWGDAIRVILTNDQPTFKAINPRTWINSTDYLELEFAPSLQAFKKQRTELVALLETLSPEDWQRSATVTGAGKPLQRTVIYYADSLPRHERPHLKQITTTAKILQNL